MRGMTYLFLFSLVVIPCNAAIITVDWDGSADYTTIQAGINAAVSGVDTVVVAEGTYIENISFGGKNIILISTDPDNPSVVASTKIDGNLSGSVVTFSGSEYPDCIIVGFTIIKGRVTGYGGGIKGNGTQATIKSCVINNNRAGHGAGIFSCDGLISNCIIKNNWSDYEGGGLLYCYGTVKNCLIYDNMASDLGGPTLGNGGGLYGCDGDIISCTIFGNVGNDGGGLYNCWGNITNCIIWGNRNVAWIFSQLDRTSIPTFSCIQDWTDGGTGNISDNPLFVTGPLGDYYLSQTAAGQDSNSPCVDAGSDTAANLGMNESTTRTDALWDIGIVDMGYHYPRNIADIYYDGFVNLEDILLMALQWLDTPGIPSADLAPEPLDNFVDYQDFGVIQQNWQWP